MATEPEREGIGKSPKRHPSRHYFRLWFRALQGVVPGALALELVLACTEKVAIAVPQL